MSSNTNTINSSHDKSNETSSQQDESSESSGLINPTSDIEVIDSTSDVEKMEEPPTSSASLNTRCKADIGPEAAEGNDVKKLSGVKVREH